MCTAISFTNGDNYFGRNLDLDFEYETRVVVTPRDYQIKFTCGDIAERHYAMIGNAVVSDNYPLYFEATNEKGLSAAALNFEGFSRYFNGCGKDYIASYEFILWVLSLNETVSAAKDKIKKIKLSDKAFSSDFLPTGLHFLIADKNESITVEQTVEGLNIYENKFGVLTNNPEFPFHKIYFENFANLSPKNTVEGKAYSGGLGAYGLPGDYSSLSRFARATFIKENSVCGKEESQSVAHFFHILESVAVPSGAVITNNGRVHKTLYSSCCNTSKGVYYYRTYNNLIPNITNMHAFDLDSKELILA